MEINRVAVEIEPARPAKMVHQVVIKLSVEEAKDLLYFGRTHLDDRCIGQLGYWTTRSLLAGLGQPGVSH